MEFHCRCGVRQGDPLSSLLFVLAVDLLDAVINSACAKGLLSLPINRPATEDFPVIQYVDNTLVVLPVDVNRIHNLHGILQEYARLNGL